MGRAWHANLGPAGSRWCGRTVRTLTAAVALRCELEPLTTAQRVARRARLRPGDVTDPAQAAKLAMK